MDKKRIRICILAVFLAACLIGVGLFLLNKKSTSPLRPGEAKYDFAPSREHWAQLMAETEGRPVHSATGLILGKGGFGGPFSVAIDARFQKSRYTDEDLKIMEQVSENDHSFVYSTLFYTDMEELNGEPLFYLDPCLFNLYYFTYASENTPVTVHWVDDDRGNHLLLEIESPEMEEAYRAFWLEQNEKKGVRPEIDELNMGLKGDIIDE